MLMVASLATASVVGVGACGSSAGDDADRARATTTTAPTEDAGIDAFCEAFPEDLFSPGFPALPPSEVESRAAEVAPLLDQLDSLAPPEIAEDTQQVTEDMRAYMTVLAKYGYSYERMSSEASASESEALDGDSPHFSNFIAYLSEHCPGLDAFPS
jgi:hypothetical protein